MVKKKNIRREKNQGSIYRLKNGTWCGAINLGLDENGKRQRKYIYGKTEEEVLNKVQHLSGTLTSVKKDSVLNSCDELLLEWLLVFKKQDVTSRVFENTMRNYRLHIRPFIQGKSILKTLNKYYASDLGVKKIKTNSKEINYSMALESIV